MSLEVCRLEDRRTTDNIDGRYSFYAVSSLPFPLPSLPLFFFLNLSTVLRKKFRSVVLSMLSLNTYVMFAVFKILHEHIEDSKFS